MKQRTGNMKKISMMKQSSSPSDAIK